METDVILRLAIGTSMTGRTASGISRSTRGASKQRRDQINRELQQLRQLLPLEESAKERLFKLQVMALTCVWIRKHAMLAGAFRLPPISPCPFSMPVVDLDHLLHDRFILSITDQGKLLCLSGNFHNDPNFCTDEFVAQGDCLQDLIDSGDHLVVTNALAMARQSNGQRVAFVCRWRAPKVGGSRRQTDWNGRPTVVEGRFVDTNSAQSKRVFAALGRPLMVHGDVSADPDMFRVWLSAELEIRQLCPNAKFHLTPFLTEAIGSTTVPNRSLYHHVHPLCAPLLGQFHRKLLLALHQSPASVPPVHLQPVLLELVTPNSEFSLRVHAVFCNCPRGKLIEGCFQVLNEIEWEAARRAKWLYEEEIQEHEEAKRKRSQGQDRVAPVAPSTPQMNFGLGPMPGWHIHGQEGHHQIQPKVKHDLNNNHLDVSSPSAAGDNEDEEGINILHQLPSQLPELDDRDLDEFFRRVEEEASAAEKPWRKRKRKKALENGGDEEEEEEEEEEESPEGKIRFIQSQV